jgi:FKBP-type peptidyl-prolyl cis-trans isomerase (trigger factor)
MLEGQLRLTVKNRMVALARQGQVVEDEEAMVASLREQMLPEARRRSHLTLVLDKIAETHGLDVSDQEIEAYLATEAREAGVAPAVLRQYYESSFGSLDAIHDKIREEKALDHALEHAQVVEPDDAPRA